MSETGRPDGRSDEDRAREEALPAQQAESETAREDADPAAQARADDDGAGSRRVALIVAVVALLVALLAIAAAALWYFGDRPTGRMAAAVGDIQHRLDRQSSALDEARVRLQKLQGVADAQQRQGKHLQQLDQGVSALKRDMAEVRRDMARLTDLIRTGQRSWALIEVEHLIEVANSRLQLRRDVDGAITALTLAQRHLARLDDPSLYRVRKAVQESITNLRAVPVPDVEGMSLTLSSLVEAVPRLPLKRDVPAEFHGRAQSTAGVGNGQQSWWQRGWNSILSALRGVVAVRRTDKPAAALLAPHHEYFLYQNLQLKLEAARLSLLQRDEAGFRTSIATSLDWLDTYFNPDAASVKAMKSQLTDLADVRLNPALPDISGGLDRVRERLDALRKMSLAPAPAQQPETQSPPGQQSGTRPPSRSSPPSVPSAGQSPQSHQPAQPAAPQSGAQPKQPQSQDVGRRPGEKPKQPPQAAQQPRPVSQPDKSRSEKAQPEEPKPEESKPEESKPEESKPEESKPEESKPAQPSEDAQPPAQPAAAPQGGAHL